MLPYGVVAEEVIPAFDSVLSYALQTDIVNFCTSKRNFGLSFAEDSRTWYIINDTDLDLSNPFSLFYQKMFQILIKIQAGCLRLFGQDLVIR